jgi:transposase
MAYDKKFRLRVIKYKDAGHTFKEVYEAFGVYSHRYYAWKKQLVETGSLEYHTAKEHKGKIDKARLIELTREHPDWFLREYAAYFSVCRQAVQKMFVKLGITRKKKLLHTLRSPLKRGANT